MEEGHPKWAEVDSKEPLDSPGGLWWTADMMVFLFLLVFLQAGWDDSDKLSKDFVNTDRI